MHSSKCAGPSECEQPLHAKTTPRPGPKRRALPELLAKRSARRCAGEVPTASGSPQDEQPGLTAPAEPTRETVRLPDEDQHALSEQSAKRPIDRLLAPANCLLKRDLTLEMSGGLKRAQHALERPLDRRVRLPRTAGEERTAARFEPALHCLLCEVLHGWQVCSRGYAINRGRSKHHLQRGRSGVSCHWLAKPTGELTANGRTARPGLAPRSRRTTGQVSSPPKDGRPHTD